MKQMTSNQKRILKNIKDTLDNVPFTSFHFKILYGLGISWVLDGYEVSLMSILSGILKQYLKINEIQIALAGSYYILGCVAGACFFGYLANEFGRKKLFTVTLLIYMVSIVITTFSSSAPLFYFSRFFTGVSVGGEYTAVFAAIDELIPPNYRGMSNIIIDGTWHLGSIIACLLSYSLLRINKNVKYKDPAKVNVEVDLTWRILFLIGVIVAIPIVILRRSIPESPRWLFLKGDYKKAKKELQFIRENIGKEEMLEKDFDIDKEENFQLKENQVNDCNEFLEKKEIVTENQKEQYLNEEESLFNIIFRVFFIMYPTRFLYALCLMVSQAFFYNGVYYTYGLVLENFFKVEKEEFGIYMIPLSISNFLGPITLGFLFDIWSRRKMIFLSYFISGVLLIISGITFTYDLLTVKDQILLWCSVFFIASPGTSAAHLTVSEVFPIDIRSQAMAIFFSISMLIGGVIAPVLFATLISQNDRYIYAYAYYISAVLMIGSSIICLIYGVDAEGKSLESLTGEIEPSTEKKEVLVKSSVS
jgi:MFS family permease